MDDDEIEYWWRKREAELDQDPAQAELELDRARRIRCRTPRCQRPAACRDCELCEEHCECEPCCG